MRSFSPGYLEAISFNDEDASTLRALGESLGSQRLYVKQTPEVLESLRQVAVIESAESSNRIEGVMAPHERIKALILKPTAPENRPEQEIAGYRDALNLIHESAVHMPFSVNVVKQLHSVLSRYVSDPGGRFKPVDNDIIERAADGTVRIRFHAVPAVATNQAMEDLATGFDRATQVEGKEPLVVVPLVILDFLCIHPFRDGNGRVARLLTLLLLYRSGYQVGRYISLERIIEESKETYYETLERSSHRWHEAAHDPLPWLRYFWGMLLRAHRELEDRVGTIRGGRGSKTAQIRAAVNRRVAPFAISDLEDELPAISRDMIRNVLRRLRDEGVIERRGQGRGTKWLRSGD